MQNIFQQGMFNVDPNSTPEQLERRRESVQRMFANGGRSQSTAEGLIKLAGGIQAGFKNRSSNKLESEKRGEATDLFERIMGARGGQTPTSSPLLGGSAPQVSTSSIPDTPQSVGADARSELGLMPASLIQTESGGNFGALNNEMGAGGTRGHGGRGQFGQARLQDAAAAGVIPAGTTPQQFSQMSPEQQIAVENWHFADIDKAINASGALGQTINGVQVTRDGLRSVAHLGGIGGMNKYVSSGGQYNPSDSFGTSLSDYASTHSQGGGQQQSAPQGGDMQALQAAMSNPWMTPDQKAVIGNMISQQQTQQQQANDPLRQLQIQQAQLDLDQQRNPQATPGFRVLGAEEAAAMGLPTDGAYQVGPDGKVNKIGGGGVNVTVGGASEVGTIPQGFQMITDPETGARSLSPIAGGPEDNTADQSASAAAAMDSVKLIDSIIDSPELPKITGMVQGNLPPMTQAGTDLNVRIQQVQGQAFLQAFESLKGGGSITEREGQAAQAAMARLNRAQSTEAYKAALTELKDIIQRGIGRANGTTPPPADSGLTDDDLKYLGLE